MEQAAQKYLEEISDKFYSGHAIEHAYRPALERLMESFDDNVAVNDPKHSEHGAPDFIFLKKSNPSIIKGYAEAKDITVNLDKTEKTDQMQRYAGYTNLFLTDYLEFRFFKNGEKYETISLGYIKDKKLYKTPENAMHLMRALEDFLQLQSESIKNGKRLAKIMGAKARRIRDNVAIYLKNDDIAAKELDKIYEMMKKLLVHDLDTDKFADMYAQTLVYGLFVARYGDATPQDFTRSEARDLVPASNPFLRHFFDHIAGTGFDARLAKIVDELCEIFSVSDVQEIVHKHLKIADTATTDAKDPIIHFYEDFLQAYDPAERKKMGAYYTPIPVVQFIVRHVDKILKEEFGITKGLASTDTITREIATQPWRKKGERKDRLTREITEPRVQILDPAVGTATFLNETIKYIYENNFKNTQEGRWPAYANENLVPRLFGFELMMAPYTVAHLKLGMTLKETGVEKLTSRLNVFLTNTLEEGIPQQPDLFSFGLAEAVSEESRLAAEVKSEKPVMVVMGNPPYSVSSNNKSKFIEKLVGDYKKDLNERNIQPLSDDYIKFIRFAEDMIAKNGSGVMAMITNNSYIDGIIHRQMRKHLMQTFDKIYVLDLHGNSKKKEVAPDGSKDVNVFDIQQGVGIILAVKTGKGKTEEISEMYHAELYGTRQMKFDEMNYDSPNYQKVNATTPNYYFVQKNTSMEQEYNKAISLNKIFTEIKSGVKTSNDKKLVSILEFTDHNHDYDYKLFDTRYIHFNKEVKRPRLPFMLNMQKENMGISFMRSLVDTENFSSIMVHRNMIDINFYGFQTYIAPLYLYHEDGTHAPNFASAELAALTRNLTSEPSPEDILDYIYGVLHSPTYRKKYKEFLKIDFPRVPAPKDNKEFAHFVGYGSQLRQLHLMKSPTIDDYATTYPVAGDDTVEKVSYQNGEVHINNTQYFGNVPEVAWNFYIGGYQPAQKWLKDRKGRKLSSDDLDHYQRIVKILLETDRIMKEIG